jgi:hypothetical protein
MPLIGRQPGMFAAAFGADRQKTQSVAEGGEGKNKTT